MKRLTCFVVVALTAVSLFAQTQPKPRDKPAAEQKPSDALSALQTAYNLAKYGYSNSSASALICAAEILVQTSTSALGSSGTQSAASGPSAVTTPEYTPANLLADAKKLAGKDKWTLPH